LALVTDNPDTPLVDLMIYAKNHLQNQFSIVPGVGNIVMGGYVDPTLRVWLDTQKLGRFDLTSQDVLLAIKNEQIEVPSGLIQSKEREFNVRLLAEATNPVDFGAIRIHSRASGGINYRPISLNQVAEIEEGTADVRRLSRSNGKKAVGLGIVKQHGSNAVEVGMAVRKKVLEIESMMPSQFHINIRTDNTRFIKQSVNQLIFTLGLSALLTSLVCYLFLGSWTTTLNVLMAIPTSIIGTFIALYFFKFTLNTFTLLGVSLAIGIVVDDAIMMLENIVRHRELGAGKREAALKGAEEITFAAVASTIAVGAIFLPVVFMKGIIGR
jgi:HAE1 family hydrophobic/amphiphilic exporter-1